MDHDCTNPEIGNLIDGYINGTLDENQMSRVENSNIDCLNCRDKFLMTLSTYIESIPEVEKIITSVRPSRDAK